MIERNKLEAFLEDLITPENDKEKDIFKREGLVDDYIEIKNRIPSMSVEELIKEINHQLSPYNLTIA